MHDFLHRAAETPLCEHYIAAGAVCRFSTNSDCLLKAARQSFAPLSEKPSSLHFSVRIWIDNNRSAQPPWPKPYVRGLDHLIFAGFDEGSSLQVDLHSRHVIGRFSPAMAEDLSYCQSVIFPVLLTIISASVGIAELHCACVARSDEGVLLAGPSGAGKSTLALALSQSGFYFLSDDRTFCSLEKHQVRAWALPTKLKLRSEATRWFEELSASNRTTAAGSPDLWLNPEGLAGVKRAASCRPRSIVFLERTAHRQFHLSPVTRTEALRRLNQDLIDEFADAAACRWATMEKVVEVPCWLLQYGGEPQAVACLLAKHLACGPYRA